MNSTGSHEGPLICTKLPSLRHADRLQASDVDKAARFWGEELGRPVDPSHPGSRGNYRMLETPPDEPIVQIQRVDHEVAST